MAEDAPVSAGDSLAPGEVDQLLAHGRPVEQLAPPSTAAAGESTAVAHDFRNPAFLTEMELRRLRSFHEEFIRYLSARLALSMRMECSLKLQRLTALTFAKFTDGLPAVAHLCLFKADPLPGVGVIDVNPRLALALVDRLLGGRGQAPADARVLTEIETALLEDLLKVVLDEWCSQWKEDRKLQPHIIGHENNGRFLQTSPRDAAMLVLAVEFGFGECVETLQIALPCYTVEPLIKARQSRRLRDDTPAPAVAPAAWRPVYEHIELPLRAEWTLPPFSLREVASLRVGDVIELPVGILEQTTVLLNGLPKFSATIGLEGERVAVQINQKLPPADEPRASHHG